MIKVMIVEDEPPILRDTKYSIEKTNVNFKVVGEAYNGDEALALIPALRPDVIMTDIKMTAMDGLELIAEVKKRYPSIVLVILTGYQEFDFLHTAMRHGVEDYLLKPLALPALRELLERIYVNIRSEWDTQEEHYFEGLLHMHAVNLPDSLSRYACFSSYVVSVGPFSTFSIGKYYYNRFIWNEKKVLQLIQAFIDDFGKVWIIPGNTGNEKIFVVAYREKQQDRMVKVTEFIYTTMTTNCDYPITLVVGQVFIQTRDIVFDIPKSILQLSKCIEIGESQLLDRARENLPMMNMLAIEPEVEKNLVLLLQKGHKEQFKKMIKLLLEQWHMQHYPQIAIEKQLKSILALCQKYTFLGLEIDLIYLELEIEEVISNSINYTEMYQGLRYIFDVFFGEKLLQKNDDSKVLVDKVEQYLKGHLSEAVSHQLLSEIFGLVPYYLSSIFKKYKGKSPCDYLLDLRIDKAKELLKTQPELLTKEVAERVGFVEQSYFSKVFKICTGMTPSDYKNGQ